MSACPFVALRASDALFQKLPVPPFDCIEAFWSANCFNIALILATPDNSVIALKIAYLGSLTSPKSSLTSLLGNPVESTILNANSSSFALSNVFLTYETSGKPFTLFFALLYPSSNILSTISRASW